MMRKALATAIAVVLAAGSTAAGANDLERLARDLERVFGPGSVEVHRRSPSSGRPALPPARAETAGVAEEDLVRAMNRERAARGLSSLQINSRLSLAAQDRVADMFGQGYFAHVAPDGTQPFVWVARRGYQYRAVGENLAVGYPSAERVVAGWMNSPGHRKNILHGSFDEIGIAVASGSPTRGYSGPTIVAIYASR